MGDHFVLAVDRLLTAANVGSQNRAEPTRDPVNKDGSTEPVSGGANTSGSKLVQCRICHDEDEDSNMETPCSCSGSLKFAHRKCVQRWCNEKGDTICEICRQQFEPGYTAPRRPLFHCAGIPMNFRGDWGFEGLGLRNLHFMTSTAADHDYLGSHDRELYSFHSPQSLICCRLIAILFILLFFLRHSLPVILAGADDFSLTLFMLLLLRTIGIVLPVYLIVKVFIALQRRRHQRDPRFSGFTSDEETELPQRPPPELRVLPAN